MKHFYENVPHLGHVAVSRHAQARMRELTISERDFADVLERGTLTPDGTESLWREGRGIRIVIVPRPTPFRGAALVTTVYRVDRKERVR